MGNHSNCSEIDRSTGLFEWTVRSFGQNIKENRIERKIIADWALFEKKDLLVKDDIIKDRENGLILIIFS